MRALPRHAGTKRVRCRGKFLAGTQWAGRGERTIVTTLVPRYVRKTKRLEGALPWLYLKGISSGEMGAALEVLVGPQARGLSASTVSRLKQAWAQEYRGWCEERLDKERWVYVWADGVFERNTRSCVHWW